MCFKYVNLGFKNDNLVSTFRLFLHLHSVKMEQKRSTLKKKKRMALKIYLHIQYKKIKKKRSSIFLTKRRL